MNNHTAKPAANGYQATEGDLLLALMNSTSDHIYFKDRESRFIKISHSMAKSFGLEHPNDAVGKSDFDIFTKDHAQPAFDDEQGVIETGESIIGKIEKETWPDGRVTWVSTSKMPLVNQSGQVIGTFGISRDVTQAKQNELELARANKELIVASRQAGMAEVATGILHNVGNILNTANLSASVVSDSIHTSKLAALQGVAAMLEEHQDDLARFLTEDERGKQLPRYIRALSNRGEEERSKITKELAVLNECIDHIKEIVNLQQNYATISGVDQRLAIGDLIEDAIRIHHGAFTRHGVHVESKFGDCPEIVTDKHSVLQILVNLLHNAKYACDYEGNRDKRISVRARSLPDNSICVEIMDTGIGIPEENLTRIFTHGFTTRKNGHGFGLHSSAIAAKDLGGTLTAYSSGEKRGATFTLTLPIMRENKRSK